MLYCLNLQVWRCRKNGPEAMIYPSQGLNIKIDIQGHQCMAFY